MAILEMPSRRIKPREIDLGQILSVLEPLKGISERADHEMYAEKNLIRMVEYASRIPRARDDSDTIVDIGSTVFWALVYNKLLGYKNVTIICRPWGSFFELFENRGLFKGINLRIVECDAEKAAYPLPSGHAGCVVSFDLLEHLAGDPMNIFSEGNRLLRPNGTLIIGTPNASQFRIWQKALKGFHPFNWSPFTESYADRHNREYTPGEISSLLGYSGFHVSELTTFKSIPSAEPSLAIRAIYFLARLRYKTVLPLHLLYGNILAVGVKTGEVINRYPPFLYELHGHGCVNFANSELPANVGIAKDGKAIILVKSAPVEISGNEVASVVILSAASEPMDILVDLFVSGSWKAGGKAVGYSGSMESKLSIQVPGEATEDCSAYFSVKAVPSGKTWKESLIDMKLPYMRIQKRAQQDARPVGPKAGKGPGNFGYEPGGGKGA